MHSFPAFPVYAIIASFSRDSFAFVVRRLDLETLDLVLEGADLAHQVRRLVGCYAAGDNSASDAAGTSESHLGRDVDVWHVLVLAEEREMEEDREWGSVRRKNDELGTVSMSR